jgi:membrane associated rhomboid family serine protease
LKLENVIGLLAALLLLAVAGLGCAAQLYRFSRGKSARLPVITLLIIGSTALVTGLQFVFPEVLEALRRNREALLGGEWWRMVTPLFVQAYGWSQACINGVGAVVFFPLAERLYGKRLLALYFIPGVLGEIPAYFWSPNAAGSSLGVVGVAGGLFGFTLLRRHDISSSAQLFAACGITAAVGLCFCRDIHGPPTIVGFLLAGIMRVWDVRRYTGSIP